MDTQFAIAISIAVGIIVAALVLRRLKRKTVVVNNLPVPLPDRFAMTFWQVGYPPVYSNVGVPQAALDAIRDGVAKQIRLSSAMFPSWTAARQPDDYQIFFIDPMATNVETDPGSPALLVNGVQAAGTTLGVGNDHNGVPTIVLPHQVATNWTHLPYLENSARFESEHFAGWLNDQSWFWRWVGVNDTHPQFPDENGQ